MARSKLHRAGRVSWQVITLGAAGLVGATAVAPSINQQLSSSKSVQVAPVGDTLPALDSFDSDEEPSGSGLGEHALLNPSTIDSPDAEASEPSIEGGESSDLVATDPRALDEHTATDLVAPPKKKQAAPSFEDSSVYKTVRVFYATDRQIVDPYSFKLWMRILFPALLGLVVSGITLLGVKYGKTRPVWIGGFTCAVLMTIAFMYHAGIYGQQTIRLAKGGGILFGARRLEINNVYPLNLGFTEVTIPKIHQKGKVERPSIFRVELSERKDRHVTIQKIQPSEMDQYFESMKEKVDSSSTHSAMIFIHGYNVLFEDAVRRTAQIANDLEFDGAPIVYSWPSTGRVTGYSVDEANVSWTVTHLEQFLLDVQKKTGVSELHIIAHSMGNRALVGALERISLKHPEAQPMFGQVVMAAPDLDAQEFASRYAKIVSTCSRQATLYTSDTDRALLASKKVHGNNRLGLASKNGPVLTDIDTVDVSPVDTSLLGHSYYGSHPLMIKDLRAIMELGHPPSLRSWLTKHAGEGEAKAWRFRTELASPQPSPMKR